MPVISQQNSLTPVILVFNVEPKNQETLIDTAKENSQTVIEKKPGFVSTSLHRSFDGTSVVNYSQWENRKSYDEAINFLSADEVKTGEKIFDLAEADWNIYELVFSSGNLPTTISTSNNITTVVNLFSVEPKDQKQLIDILQLLSKEFVEKQPSFISANVHRSLDGNRVVSYAQWKSKEDYQAIYANVDAQPFLDDIKKIAKFSWNLYEVVYTSD